MHPFQRSGLGLAPFRCIGVTENVFVMPGGYAKAGGSCDYCGTGIRWEFHIRSSDGKKFKVGCDCVAKTEREYGAEVESFRAVRLEHARQRRQAGAQTRREARQKAWDEERKARQEQRLEETAGWRQEHAALVARLQGYDGSNEFVRDMGRALAHYGALTDRQRDSVERSFATQDRIEAQRKNSKHVGEIGKRIKGAKVRVNRSIEIGREPFYPYAPRYLVALEDERGNALTWFTSVNLIPFEEHAEAAFTVKDHSIYNGVQQTVVQRLKFKD